MASCSTPPAAEPTVTRANVEPPIALPPSSSAAEHAAPTAASAIDTAGGIAPVPAAGGVPVIDSFTVDKDEDIVPGDPLTFRWTATAGISATLKQIQFNGMVGDWGRFGLPPSGQVTIVAGTARNTHTFELTVANTAGTSVSRNLKLIFRCPYTYFFSPAPAFCPDGPPESRTVAEQPFENGRMVWVPEDGHAFIYVLFTDGSVVSRQDSWTEGQPEIDPSLTPPVDRFQPRRGFGAFWREGVGLRQRLGWALEPEQAAETQVQRESGGVDFKGSNTFLRLADGSIIQIIGHYVPYSWQVVAK